MKATVDTTSDLHMHTRYSDGAAGIRETIEAAVQKGFRKIALTDHMPLPFENRYAMSVRELNAYRAEIREVRAAYRGVIEVLVGLEMEYLPGLEPWTEKIAAAGWEHAIGSVHGMIMKERHGMVNGTRTEFERLLSTCFGGDIRTLAAHYYAQVQRIAASGLFHTVGHMDVLKKHNREEAYFSEEEEWYQALVRETLDRIEASSMSVEINLSGYDHPVGAPYPSPWIAAECRRRGIPLILSSDAHCPGNIGRNFEKAAPATGTDDGQKHYCPPQQRRLIPSHRSAS